MKGNIIIGIIAIALGFLLGVTVIKQDTPQQNIINTTADTTYIYDTVEIISYMPGEKYVRVDTQWVTEPVDSAAVFEAYYSVYVTTDTLVDDSTLFVALTDSLTQNRIFSRTPFIAKHYPMMTNTVTVEVSDNGWFIGGFVGTDYGIAAHYKVNKNLFGARFGLNTAVVEYSRRIGRK